MGAESGPARLTLLQRREIEAEIVGPLVRAFADEIGVDRALTVVARVVEGLARDGGAAMAQSLGETSLTAFSACLERWQEGGALEIEVRQQTDSALDFDVVRCRYAEMYRRLGLADLGAHLSCVRDFALVEGFNPDIHLTRTQTLMEGASHCDFRFRKQGSTPSSGAGGT